MKKSLTLLLVFFIFCIFQGCTSREWFEGLKGIQRQDCYKIESPTERQECLDKVDGQSYDQYKKDREAVVKKPDQK